MVALRKESVDRNFSICYIYGNYAHVALRKESVDRNMETMRTIAQNMQSLSARRAWIEMVIDFPLEKFAARRSPQGERG